MSEPIGWNFEDIRVLKHLPENCLFVPWNNISISCTKAVYASSSRPVKVVQKLKYVLTQSMDRARLRTATELQREIEMKSKWNKLMGQDQKEYGHCAIPLSNRHKLPINIATPIQPRFYGDGLVVASSDYRIYGCYRTQQFPNFIAGIDEDIHEAEEKITELQQKPQNQPLIAMAERRLRKPTAQQLKQGIKSRHEDRKQWRAEIKELENWLEELRLQRRDRRPKRIAWHSPHTCFVVDGEELKNRVVEIEKIGFSYMASFLAYKETAGKLYNEVQDCPAFLGGRVREIEEGAVGGEGKTGMVKKDD